MLTRSVTVSPWKRVCCLLSSENSLTPYREQVKPLHSACGWWQAGPSTSSGLSPVSICGTSGRKRCADWATDVGDVRLHTGFVSPERDCALQIRLRRCFSVNEVTAILSQPASVRSGLAPSRRRHAKNAAPRQTTAAVRYGAAGTTTYALVANSGPKMRPSVFSAMTIRRRNGSR